MQLNGCRKNTESPFQLSSSIATSQSSSTSDVDVSVLPSAFRPSSFPQTSVTSNTSYLLPVWQQHSDLLLADTFPFILDTGLNDLQKGRFGNLISAAPSDKPSVHFQVDPISRFSFRFPPGSEDRDLLFNQVPKNVHPWLPDPYLLTSLGTSTKKDLNETQIITSDHHINKDASISGFSEKLLGNGLPCPNSSSEYNPSQSVPAFGLSSSKTTTTSNTELFPQGLISRVSAGSPQKGRVVSSEQIQDRFPQNKVQTTLIRLLSSNQEESLQTENLMTTNCPVSLKLVLNDMLHDNSGMMTSTSRHVLGDPILDAIPCHDIQSNGGKNGGDVKEKGVPSNIRQSSMYQTFQTWATKNYGDTGKTKTVTRNKYLRIVRILTGEEQFTAENSKFRFWVKAKGFQLSTEAGDFDNDSKVLLVPSKHPSRMHDDLPEPQDSVAESQEIVFSKTSESLWEGSVKYSLENKIRVKAVQEAGLQVEQTGEILAHISRSKLESDDADESQKTFKRVAVVENFFDIIYTVHVEMDGRGGKHAGQKRTYRAIAETYSFLPREAVTRFLMSCTDCQKRMQLSMESNNNNSISAEDRNDRLSHEDSAMSDPLVPSDYKVPSTQTFVSQQRDSKKEVPCDFSDHDDESESSYSVMSTEASPSVREVRESTDVKEEKDFAAFKNSSNNNTTESSYKPTVEMTTARRTSPQPMETENRATDSSPEDALSRKSSPVPGKITEGKGHSERKRRASSESGDSAMTKTSEGKDDDDEDDNDDDEKILVGQDIDPERLKAFNMFVRLFVDENLDRMVPISKQPKDKIQAILEACDRQFPEFHERSRKRIRTYLKSCRRMRRSKEHNGWEPLRPTPPHLTSAAAESLLATACENESQNAKRMRLGLEPLPASAMVSHNTLVTSQTPPSTQPSSQPQTQPVVTQTPTQPSNISSPRSINCSVPASTDFLRSQPPPATFRGAPEFTPSFFTNGQGAGLFRPGFPSFQHSAHHPSMLSHAPISSNATTNGEFGPTDLSMKKSSNKGQLSPSEVTAIKQLIAGYRESAAFLYRSADELEQLLLQQN